MEPLNNKRYNQLPWVKDEAGFIDIQSSFKAITGRSPSTVEKTFLKAYPIIGSRQIAAVIIGNVLNLDLT